MTGKSKKPLTQPEPGDPNYQKSCYQPGSLPVSDLPMQPSLKEQMQQSEHCDRENICDEHLYQIYESGRDIAGDCGECRVPNCKKDTRTNITVPAFDHKACVLCDHVIVQQVLGNKCKLSGALCCYMRSCPEEERKRREAVKAKPEPKYYLITDDDLETIRGYVIGAMQGEEPTKIEELMMSEYSCIRSRSADLAGESIKAFTKGHVAGSTAENRRALEILDKFYDNIKVAHRHDTSNYSEGLLDGIDLSIMEIKNESLRLPQPEPTEREPE